MARPAAGSAVPDADVESARLTRPTFAGYMFASCVCRRDRCPGAGERDSSLRSASGACWSGLQARPRPRWGSHRHPRRQQRARPPTSARLRSRARRSSDSGSPRRTACGRTTPPATPTNGYAASPTAPALHLDHQRRGLDLCGQRRRRRLRHPGAGERRERRRHRQPGRFTGHCGGSATAAAGTGDHPLHQRPQNGGARHLRGRRRAAVHRPADSHHPGAHPRAHRRCRHRPPRRARHHGRAGAHQLRGAGPQARSHVGDDRRGRAAAAGRVLQAACPPRLPRHRAGGTDGHLRLPVDRPRDQLHRVLGPSLHHPAAVLSDRHCPRTHAYSCAATDPAVPSTTTQAIPGAPTWTSPICSATRTCFRPPRCMPVSERAT